MSQIITDRVRTSRRSLLKGITAAGARIAIGLPPLVSMFNSTRHRLCRGTDRHSRHSCSQAVEKPIESRFVLWFNGNGIPERYWIPSEEGTRLRTDAVPGPAGGVAQRCPCAERSGQRGRQRQRQRPHQLHERPDDRHGFHRPRPERTVHRPDYCGQDRRRFAFPLAADRCGAGIVWREHAAQHELGRIRTGAAARDDSAPAVRSPVWGARRRLGEPEAQHSGYGAGGCFGARKEAAGRRQDAGGRASVGYPRSGALHCRACRRSITASIRRTSMAT